MKSIKWKTSRMVHHQASPIVGWTETNIVLGWDSQQNNAGLAHHLTSDPLKRSNSWEIFSKRGKKVEEREKIKKEKEKKGERRVLAAHCSTGMGILSFFKSKPSFLKHPQVHFHIFCLFISFNSLFLVHFCSFTNHTGTLLGNESSKIEPFFNPFCVSYWHE